MIRNLKLKEFSQKRNMVAQLRLELYGNKQWHNSYDEDIGAQLQLYIVKKNIAKNCFQIVL